MYVAQIIAEDMDSEEGPLHTIGPYPTWDDAQEAGDALLQFVQDEFPDHDWDAVVEEVKTYEEVTLEYRKEK